MYSHNGKRDNWELIHTYGVFGFSIVIHVRAVEFSFQDLTSKTIQSEKIILVIQLMRIGVLDIKRASPSFPKDIKRPVAVGRMRDFFQANIHQQASVHINLIPA